MNRNIALTALIVIIASVTCHADIFKHRDTDDTFHGYLSEKQLNNKATAYILQPDGKYKSKTVDPSEYAITYDTKGRRNNVIAIQVKQAEILLSVRVSEKLSQVILQAANKGPRYIILEIDNPGGRPENMKIVCDQINDITHCPVIAYISGGDFDGAHAAASAIAMACDEIYIAPSASMSTIPSPPRSVLTTGTGDTSLFYQTYVPQNLPSYSSYVAALAVKNNRPQVIAMGLINTGIDVIEVETESSKSEFVDKKDKRPSMKLIANWSKSTGTLALPYNPYGTGNSDVAPEAKEAMQLTLSAEQAVQTGIAKKIIPTSKELYTTLNAADAKLQRNSLVLKEARRFLSSKNKIAVMLSNVDQLWTRIDELDNMIDNVQKLDLNDMTRNQINNNTDVQSVNKAGTGARRDRSRSIDIGNYGARHETSSARGKRQNNNQAIANSLIQERNARLYQINVELYRTLNTLISNFDAIFKHARTFPGAMPLDVDVTSLRQDMTDAVSRRNAMQ